MTMPVLIPVCDDHMTSLHTRLQSRVVFYLIDNTPSLGYYTRCGGLGSDGRDCKTRASHKAEVK